MSALSSHGRLRPKMSDRIGPRVSQTPKRSSTATTYCIHLMFPSLSRILARRFGSRFAPLVPRITPVLPPNTSSSTPTTFTIRMVQGVAIQDGCILDTNPATGELIAKVPVTQNVDELVAIAKKAYPSWRQTPLEERIGGLKKGLQQLATIQDDLARTMTQEMGKPLKEAREELQGAIDRDEYFDILAKTLQPSQRGGCKVVRDPVGIVTILSPWNYPVDEILLLALPALASGNVVIVKPSEVAPLSGQQAVEALAACLPDGVVQVAQGDGDIGAMLVNHPAIRMVAMTGSSATGKKIMSNASAQLKRVILELGGKDPMVVFADADLDTAAQDAVAFSLDNTGQVCCSIERIYVAEEIQKEFTEKVTELAKDYKVGNGLDESVKVGPMVSTMQRDVVQQHVQDAVDKGASLNYQGPIPEGKGNFFPVTVLSNVKEDMKIYREETFGPIVSIISFDGTENEAIRLANDTEYGLASSVYTKDMEKAERVGNAIEAGQVGINCYSLCNMDVGCPWVGHKQSGMGFHSGYEGFLQFSLPKTLVFR